MSGGSGMLNLAGWARHCAGQTAGNAADLLERLAALAERAHTDEGAGLDLELADVFIDYVEAEPPGGVS